MHAHTPLGESPAGANLATPAILAESVRRLAFSLGIDAVGFAAAEIDAARRQSLRDWLAAGRHGEMDYMARHAALRGAPDELRPGTLSVISARLGYGPQAAGMTATLARPDIAYVSRYALGRDYHKIFRRRLQTLAGQIAGLIGPFGHRVFVDSAPVMEVELARQAGLGWRGKHTLLLSQQGSWNFLGEIFTDLPLPPDTAVADRCGRCTRCIAACPTQAIVAPYEIDARRCISYLTIEHKSAIPEALRAAIGNRIYGCDDCQLACPWNRHAAPGNDPDFSVRQALDASPLTTLFAWSESDFNDRLAGSAIRRIGHGRWLRNIAVALGNAAPRAETLTALQSRADHSSALVRDHVAWALQQAHRKTATGAA